MLYDTLLFLDFDGTVTSQDTLAGCMRLAVDEDLYRQKQEEVLAGKISLAQALREGFSTIPSHRAADMLAYVRSVPLRPGLEDFLDRMEAAALPVVVISGGLQAYVEELLAPFCHRILAIHSVGWDLSGPTMRLCPQWEGQGFLMEKTRVMETYRYKRAVCVGDGYSDLLMARACQQVFARDELAVETHHDRLSRWQLPS